MKKNGKKERKNERKRERKKERKLCGQFFTRVGMTVNFKLKVFKILHELTAVMIN